MQEVHEDIEMVLDDIRNEEDEEEIADLLKLLFFKYYKIGKYMAEETVIYETDY